MAVKAGAGGVRCGECGATAAAAGDGRPMVLRHEDGCSENVRPSLRADRDKVIEDRAARMAYIAGLGASEWPAFVGIAEDVLTAEGVIYQWRYGARRAPGTEKPGVWIQSTGPETSRVSDHRTMLGARFKAWRLNRGHGWREAVREEGVAAGV